MVAHDIRKALQELAIACEVISGAHKCGKCPFYDICFEEYNIVDTVNKMDDARIDKFTEMAETIEEERKESEKTESQRRWEHEADAWLDRRKELHEL